MSEQRKNGSATTVSGVASQSPLPSQSMSDSKLSWAQKKEEQARERKRQNDLAKTEKEIEQLEEKKDALSELYTVLQPAYTTDEAGAEILDLANSIYSDWGAFINSIINFLLIALVLFTIVKVINKIRENQEALADRIDEGKPTKEERREMKNRGIRFSDKAAVAEFYAEKAKKIAEEKAAAEEKARLDRLANPTTEDLLKEIRDLLKK